MPIKICNILWCKCNTSNPRLRSWTEADWTRWDRLNSRISLWKISIISMAASVDKNKAFSVYLNDGQRWCAVPDSPQNVFAVWRLQTDRGGSDRVVAFLYDNTQQLSTHTSFMKHSHSNHCCSNCSSNCSTVPDEFMRGGSPLHIPTAEVFLI